MGRISLELREAPTVLYAGLQHEENPDVLQGQFELSRFLIKLA